MQGSHTLVSLNSRLESQHEEEKNRKPCAVQVLVLSSQGSMEGESVSKPLPLQLCPPFGEYRGTSLIRNSPPPGP